MATSAGLTHRNFNSNAAKNKIALYINGMILRSTSSGTSFEFWISASTVGTTQLSIQVNIILIKDNRQAEC